MPSRHRETVGGFFISTQGDNIATKLLFSASDVGTSEITNFSNSITHPTGLLQVEITTASVRVEGRVSPDAPWVMLTDAELTASGLFAIAMCNFMRVRVMSHGSGDVNVWVQSAG